MAKNFSQYLAEARAKYGTQAPPKPLDLSAFKKKPEQPALDTLSWAIDIASRPMRAIQNVPNQILNEALKAQEAEKTGGTYDVLGGVGNILTSGPRGFFSTNPDDQPYGAQLIEKATDVVGQANDRGYVNEQDNVNPWVKGIGGFALDVGLDPLTYVPGGAIVAGTRGARAAAQAATGLGKVGAAVKGIKSGTGMATPYKIGSLEKQMKPVGIDQWRETQAFSKLNKAGLKNNIPAESLIKFSDGGDINEIVNGINSGIWSRAREAGKTVPESKYVTPSTFLSTFKSKENLIPKAKAYDTRLQEVDAVAQIAKQQAAFDATRAGDEAAKNMDTTVQPKPEAVAPVVAGTSAEEKAAANLMDGLGQPTVAAAPKTIVEKFKAIQEEGRVAPVLKDALNASEEVTAAGRVKPFDEWVTGQLELSKTDKTLRIPTASGKSLSASRLDDYNKFSKALPGTLSARDLARKEQLDDLIQDAYDNYVTSLGGVKAPKSAGLKEWLANPANRAVADAALGEKASADVGVLSEAKIKSAFDYVSKAIENPESLASVESFGRSAEQRFAKNIVNAYESRKIEDLPVVQVESESRVLAPEVAEINAANEAGENLYTQPWASGLRNEEEAKFIVAAVKAFWAEALVNRVGLKFDSPRGAKKSQPEMFEGTANWINQFNGTDQSILWQNIAEPTYRRFKDRNDFLRLEDRRNEVIAGARRATEASVEIKRLFDSARRLIDQELGVAAWLGKGDVRIPMYLDQAIDTLRIAATEFGDKTLDRHLVNMAVFNINTSIPLNNIGEAIAAKVSNPLTSDDEIRAILRQKTKANNILTDKDLDGRFGFKPGPAKPSPAKGMTFEPKPDPKNPSKVIGWYGVAKPKEFEDAFVKLINDATPSLQKVADENRIAAAARTNAEYIDITNEQWQRITDMVMGADNTADGIRMMANISKGVAEAGSKGRATFDAQANASRDIADMISNNSIHAAQDYVKTERILSAYKADAEIGQKVAEKNWADKYYAKWGEERVAASKDPMNGVDDAGNVINEADYAAAIGREAYGLRMGRVRQMLMSFFNKGYGAEDVIYPWASQEANFSKMIHQYDSGLAGIAKKYNTPIGSTKTTVAQKALQDIANRNFDDPITKDAVEELRPYVEFLFGTDKDRGLTSVWLAEGANLDAFETYVTRAGKLEFLLDKEAISLIAKRDNLSEVRVAMASWGDWLQNVDNPFDFLQRMNYAAQRYVSDKSLALSLQTVRGGTSMKPAIGFTNVGKNFQYGANPLLAHLPANLHINDELLGQIKQLEAMTLESGRYHGPFKDFINDKYQPLLSAWKFNVTVLRLGHHLRNHFSNKSIQFLDQGTKNYAWSDRAGWQMTMAYRKSDAMDFIKQAQTLDLREMPTPRTPLFNSKRFGEVTVEKANKQFERGGMYEGYMTVEDVIANEAGGAIGKFSDIASFKGTPIARWAGGLSELQSWQNRAAYVLQFVRNNADSGLYKTEDELWTAAMEKARRAMPSNLMLTNKEKQLRLIIPFYGWFRQALPVIAEGIVTQPGRFMMIPKASFNLAIGMGVNPYQMYDPFPDDQLFPSFVEDQLLGPIAKVNGKYYTVNPGLAPVDILNQFVPDPIRGVAGMSTPFIKVPGELLGGSNWGTGARINDMSDYWDAQLPGINYLSNMTGTSVTGSVVSLLQGQGLDPQYSVLKGNKTPTDQGIGVANWFTGLGVQNMSKESLINYAEIEKRNKAAQEQAKLSGEYRSPF